MKYKTSIVVLVSSFSAVALILFAIVITLFAEGNLSKRTAGILLPSEGGYVEAWSEQAPSIAHKLDIPEITVYPYKDYQELESYMLQAEKYNILWAEIPVCAEFDLKTLLKKVAVSPVDLQSASFFPNSIYKKVYDFAGQKKASFIPLSYNPWVMSENQNKNSKAPFTYSLGGNSQESALAFLNYVKIHNGKNLSNNEGLQIISSMSNDKTLIKNACTYTNRDAFIAMENGTTNYCFMPMSFFNGLSISQRQAIKIKPVSDELITDVTIAVFPVRKSDENKENIEKAKQLLLSPEIMYATANSRGWLPALINTVSRSSYTDSIKKQARSSNSCYIPGLQYSTSEEKTQLCESLNSSLRTMYSSK
ncbi:MAG: hypothetical protein K5839_05135 [Treponemataceae bacterium]|nr:hypothetical protein [Treponemataceae bacterium]